MVGRMPIDPVPPQDVVRPDPRSLRALAHPLRLQLLGLLRADGPATASQLAARTGQSSGATSYHLRQLAEFGFVQDAEERGNARDRWWRAVHRSTEFDFPEDVADEEGRALGEQYLRVVADTYARRLDAAIAAFPTIHEDLGPGWLHGFTMSDQRLRLTRDEAETLVAELLAVVRRYRQDRPETRADAPTGSQRVAVQWQVLPVPPATSGEGGGHEVPQ
jgi:DNA-binding transcriptional ArsR family regulator